MVVVDILDTLYLYKSQMELQGLNSGLLDNVRVIKIGGRLHVGNVITRLSFGEPVVREKEAFGIVKSILDVGDKIVSLVLGFDKLFFVINSRTEALSIVNIVLGYTGNPKGIGYYFINTELLEKNTPNILPLLEEVATTVVEIRKKGKSFFLNVKKSINSEIDGVEVKL